MENKSSKNVFFSSHNTYHATDWTTGEPGFDFRREKRFFSHQPHPHQCQDYLTATRQVVGLCHLGKEVGTRRETLTTM